MPLEYPNNLTFKSRRSPIFSDRGIVATSQPLATAIGLKILSQGGNAADAAVAAAAALNVTEPTSTGIGGDCFALFYAAKEHRVYAMNASGHSPKALTHELVRSEGFENELPPYHPHTITVPGAAAGWHDLIARFGNLSLKAVLSPAIELAERGFPVSPITAHFWARDAAHQLNSAPNGSELTIDGRAPHPGERFRNPGLARTFTQLAERGLAGFYQGAIAEAITQVIQEAGGVMTMEDLVSHKTNWPDPISTEHQGYRVWECPPNGQGLAALLALNILNNFELKDLAPASKNRLHLMIEAMRLAFADTRWFVADPDRSPVPVTELLSKSYAEERARLINLSKATIDQSRGTPTRGSDTVYLSVVDEAGNACSFINSNYMGFGTGFVPKGWGFTLQNRGHGFSLQEGHPNILGPNKRPYHTIIPSMITHQNTGDLFASFGVMGGFMQPQGHLQVAVNLIHDKLDPQSALDEPRFCITDGQAGGEVALEEGINIETMSDLANMGHKVIPTSGHARAIFGRGQIIIRDRDTGILCSGSDPRSDGQAAPLI
jgi:gamma-glutamyltranspeptidase/glutathione hydrolase